MRQSSYFLTTFRDAFPVCRYTCHIVIHHVGYDHNKIKLVYSIKSETLFVLLITRCKQVTYRFKLPLKKAISFLASLLTSLKETLTKNITIYAKHFFNRILLKCGIKMGLTNNTSNYKHLITIKHINYNLKVDFN